MRRMLLGLGLLWCALACGGVPDLQTTLGATCSAMGSVMLPTEGLVQVGDSVEAPPKAVTLWVSDDAYDLDGEWIGGKEDATLGERLTQRNADVAAMAEVTGAAKGELLLAIDGSIEGARVVRVLEAAHTAGFSTVHVLFRSEREQTPGPFVDEAYAAELEATLANQPPEMRQTLLAREIEGLIVVCPGAQSVFAAIANATPESKCPLMIQGLQEALPSCPLTDSNKVITAVQVGFQPPKHALTVRTVRLDPKASVLEIPAAKSWSEIVAGWKSTGEPMWWRAAP